MRRLFISIALVIVGSFTAFPPTTVEGKTNAIINASNSAAGFKFPSRVGLFLRQGSIKFDQGGNPYASYWAGGLILADVFYYRTYGHTLEREYSDCKDYVKMVSPNARLISDSAISITPGGHAHRGRRAVFTVQKGRLAARGPAKSQLLIFPHNDRFLKFRITYPQAHAERAEQEIDNFVRSFPWPPD
jgi:hypothetical protein